MHIVVRFVNKQKQVHPRAQTTPTAASTLESRSPLLPSRCSHKSCFRSRTLITWHRNRLLLIIYNRVRRPQVARQCLKRFRLNKEPTKTLVFKLVSYLLVSRSLAVTALQYRISKHNFKSSRRRHVDWCLSILDTFYQTRSYSVAKPNPHSHQSEQTIRILCTLSRAGLDLRRNSE
jgi:hypothetical protein